MWISTYTENSIFELERQKKKKTDLKRYFHLKVAFSYCGESNDGMLEQQVIKDRQVDPCFHVIKI